MLTMLVPMAVQTVEPPSGIVLASEVAEIVIALAMLVLAGLGIVLFVRANALLKDVRAAADRSLGPVGDRARAISDNVEFITQALRTDVERLNASVRSLSERLQEASDRMEERIQEFNALMEVVQGEAEEVFLDTASTVRGVREGARTITERARRRDDTVLREPASAPRVAPAPDPESAGPLDAPPADPPAEGPSEEHASAHRDD